MLSKFQNIHKSIPAERYQIEQLYDHIHIYLETQLLHRLKSHSQHTKYQDGRLIFFTQNLCEISLFDIENGSNLSLSTSFPIESVHFSAPFLLVKSGVFAQIVNMEVQDQSYTLQVDEVYDSFSTFLFRIQNQLFTPSSKSIEIHQLAIQPKIVKLAPKVVVSDGFSLWLLKWNKTIEIPLYDGKPILNFEHSETHFYALSQTFIYIFSAEMELRKVASISTFHSFKFFKSWENVNLSLVSIPKLTASFSSPQIVIFHSQSSDICLVCKGENCVLLAANGVVWSVSGNENVAILSVNDIISEFNFDKMLGFGIVVGDHQSVVSFGNEKFGVVRDQ